MLFSFQTAMSLAFQTVMSPAFKTAMSFALQTAMSCSSDCYVLCFSVRSSLRAVVSSAFLLYYTVALLLVLDC